MWVLSENRESHLYRHTDHDPNLSKVPHGFQHDKLIKRVQGSISMVEKSFEMIASLANSTRKERHTKRTGKLNAIRG